MVSETKALTLAQPWATLVVHGHKSIAVQPERTAYRGRLAIYAAPELSDEAIDLYFAEPFRTALRNSGVMTPADLPLGAIIGYVRLVGCLRSGSHQLADIPETERAFDTFVRGRWAWVFTEPVALAEPMPVDGQEGLWTLTDWQ